MSHDDSMKATDLIAVLNRYRAELEGILSRFDRTRDGIHINREDDPVFRQRVLELRDLFHDALGPNSYSEEIVAFFNDGISNFSGSPSYKSVENIIGVVGAASTRITRRPDLADRPLPREKSVLNEQKLGLQLAILQTLASVHHQHKFNLLGKGTAQGDLERQMGVHFDAERRRAAAIGFAELEKAGLIAPTYDDLIAPDLWFAITDQGRVVLAKGTIEELNDALGGSTEPAQEKELEQKFKILFSAGQALADFAELLLLEDGSQPMALLFIDIDKFKALNTTYSETVIDETILPEFQRLLKSAVLHRGYAYRHGGEEFVVLLPNHVEPEGAAFAERLRATCENHAFKVHSEDVHVTISVGVASYPKDGSTFTEVLQKANVAEHAAKAAGRNRVVVA